MYDRHLYPGGAARLHTLRGELGDEAFWSGVQRYVKRYAGQVVETDDFRRELEAALLTERRRRAPAGAAGGADGAPGANRLVRGDGCEEPLPGKSYNFV